MSIMPPVTSRDHALGPADAAVTLVEYGDYQCPYCAAAHPLVQRTIRKMGNDLRFIFRNFPITQIHHNAEPAAEAAEMAADLGKFWEMHDVLFERRDDWIDAPDPDPIAKLAAEAGLDAAAVRRAIDAHEYDQRIRDDFVGGVRSGVNGTPTFFVNGVRYDGRWDGDGLLVAVQEARDAAFTR